MVEVMDAPDVTAEPLIHQYVILVNPQPVNIQVNTNEWLNVFGDLGRGQFAQINNGFQVSAGDFNRIVFAPPKIIFTGATLDRLISIYDRARQLIVTPHFRGPARGFGINFEMNITLESMSRTEFFQRVRNPYIPESVNTRILTLTWRNVLTNNPSNIRFELSNTNIESIFVSINNHIANPTEPSYLPDELRQLAEILYRESVEKLENLSGWIRQHN